jgi:translation initiation factor 1A
MPGGKKHRKSKKHSQPQARKLTFAGRGQVYAQVKKSLGDRRMEVADEKGNTFSARVRGKFRKRVWINKGDWVLIEKPGLGESGQQACMIIHVYKPFEVRKLIQAGELSTTAEEFLPGDEEFLPGDEEFLPGDEEFAEFQAEQPPEVSQTSYLSAYDLPPSQSSEYESETTSSSPEEELENL